MAQQSKNTLQSAINSQIADNTSGNITAANVRNNFINITDSLVFNTGSQVITGSLTLTGGITGSLRGTAATASYVPGVKSITYGYYPNVSADYNPQTTASYTYISNIPALLGTYCTVDLTVTMWSGFSGSLQIKLYASTNPTSSTVGDTLIGTFSGSLGSVDNTIQKSYKFKRSFYPFFTNDPEMGISWHNIAGANPTASMLSDESNTTNSSTIVSTWYDPAYNPAPYLKITYQTGNAGLYSYTFGLGPLRVTYDQ